MVLRLEERVGPDMDMFSSCRVGGCLSVLPEEIDERFPEYFKIWKFPENCVQLFCYPGVYKFSARGPGNVERCCVKISGMP